MKAPTPSHRRPRRPRCTYLLAESVIRRLADWIDADVLHALLANDLPSSLADEAPPRLRRPPAGRRRRRRHHHRRPRRSHRKLDLDIARMHHGNRKRTRIDADFLASRRLPHHPPGQRIHLRPHRPWRRHAPRRKQQAVTSFADAITWMLWEVERGLSNSATKASAK